MDTRAGSTLRKGEDRVPFSRPIHDNCSIRLSTNVLKFKKQLLADFKTTLRTPAV